MIRLLRYENSYSGRTKQAKKGRQFDMPAIWIPTVENSCKHFILHKNRFAQKNLISIWNWHLLLNSLNKIYKIKLQIYENLL